MTPLIEINVRAYPVPVEFQSWFRTYFGEISMDFGPPSLLN